MFRLAIEVGQLVRVVPKVVQFPFFTELVKVHQLVALGADAVVAGYHVDTWVFVVVVVDALAPVIRGLPFEQGYEGTALHVDRDLCFGHV